MYSEAKVKKEKPTKFSIKYIFPTNLRNNAYSNNNGTVKLMERWV